ncbi:MAG: cache domain-containing protein [Trebonia sp.]
MGDLGTPASRVRALLEGVFGPVTAIGDGFVAQRRDCLAAGAALTPDRLSGLREIIWHQLSLLPAADGAGIVAAPGVVAGKDRHLEWWQRTAYGDSGTDGFARIRLNLDPESVDLYDYLDMDWFTIPRHAGRPYVYGPHVDFSCADRYVVTMTVPVTDASAPNSGPGGEGAAGQPEFLGVAGADIRMSHLEPELLAILRSVPSPAVLVTAERRVVAANTPHWISGTRLPRLPAAGDGAFAAVTEIGAHSGWLLAAAPATLPVALPRPLSDATRRPRIP